MVMLAVVRIGGISSGGSGDAGSGSGGDSGGYDDDNGDGGGIINSYSYHYTHAIPCIIE